MSITSRNRLSLKAWLPTKAMRLTSVLSPSWISKTTFDPVLVELDDLRLDTGGEAATLGIGVQQLLPVGLGQRRGEHAARPLLQLRPQHIVGELVVALEGDAVDDRVLDHVHHQRVAVATQIDVREKPGRIQRLQAAIELVGIERVASLHQHVGEDRAFLDALIALDPDGRDRVLGLASARARSRRACGRGLSRGCLARWRRPARRGRVGRSGRRRRTSRPPGGGLSGGGRKRSGQQAEKRQQRCASAKQKRYPPTAAPSQRSGRLAAGGRRIAITTTRRYPARA